MSALTSLQKTAYGILAVLGFSFFFFLGYPFANHNESFVIVPQLAQMDIGDALTSRIYPVANYRPLGQAVAWLGYHLGGGTIYSVEIFNYVVAVIAWLVLFLAVRDRRVFSVAALVVGGVLFSGYIYLFHLHGVFYSPLLLLVATLFHLDAKPITARLLLTTALVALVAAFFHPYALPIYLAALVGFYLERRGEFARFGWILTALIGTGIVLIVLLVIIPRHESLMTAGEMLSGLAASYQMVEVHPAVSAVVALLVVLTALSFPGGSRTRRITLVASLAGVVAAHVLDTPLLSVWIAVTLVKMLLLRKWWLVFVIGGTAMLPAPAATGSPTYTIFVLMACTGGLAMSWNKGEDLLVRFGDRLAIPAILLALCVWVLLRAGIEIPLLSPVVRPIVAEREKTQQLEDIVDWLLASEYAQHEPVLLRSAENPVAGSDAVDRTYRPPTDQEYLSKYVRFRRGGDPGPGKIVLLGFGGEPAPRGRLLFAVEASQAGPARVYLPPAD